MTEKIRETEAQLKALIARRNQLLDWRNARKEMKTMEKISIYCCPVKLKITEKTAPKLNETVLRGCFFKK
ncbi:MAG: hypothetical protein ACI3YI_13755 [Bacteroidaceae bacterium]